MRQLYNPVELQQQEVNSLPPSSPQFAGMLPRKKRGGSGLYWEMPSAPVEKGETSISPCGAVFMVFGKKRIFNHERHEPHGQERE
jgi:hypothetical protein